MLRAFTFAIAMSAAVLAQHSAFAQAQNWPNRPVRMIVPYTGGGYTDNMARTVGAKISEAIGQPLVYENRPGANSVIGAEVVAKAAPDGYTFGTVIAGHSANQTLNPKLPFDVVKDFTYVSLMSVAPLMLVARKDLPIKNVKEMIAYAKANPGKLNFASSGIGSAAHLTMELLKAREGLNMQHVPYRGTQPALTDLIGGRVDVMFDTVSAFMSHVEAGTINAIAVTAKGRMPSAPSVPTMGEQGVQDFVTGTWAGIIAPAGTPKAIVDRVAAESKKALADPAMKAQLEKLGYEAVGNTPEEYTAFLKDEVARWGKVIKDADIKLEQ
ncbi:tripartite tricarboxylate transporter family receptor [Variibacter gotjawalensis]|uniref:Tripartite tricarboxylate transporter family receptor n=1 Tax=Variibacter gotjawalensis TaxID=1333996 RepID=A0A0S3PY59_9BRAD|nr:tripartite tricarboxylate transporter substrate binding protein [Variibacter gotjawalensis]NIK46698.1 tripartite-type tricarboxylate transporter receptor subunit TctC [Variibacter gotjawalensis]RZS48601.1 tripartite-type tricarboxylate transporter receptor subunit TctC [Variibacter gotjawalensis]BAT60863.1 tripartite tricarboxylate transporter family receptor [Variibacter gotjawalensis]